MRSFVTSCVVVLVLAAAADAITWTPLLTTEDFSNPAATGWTYTGPAGEPDLFSHNAGTGKIDAEWDQDKVFKTVDAQGAGLDPFIYQPSSYSRSLGQTLTENDYFQVGATVVVDSIADTTAIYQVANFGLYNLAEMGPDRVLVDNWLSGQDNKVKDGSDFVEFNYFIGTNWAGRHGAAIIGAHIDAPAPDNPGNYVYGAPNAYLGTGALPTGTPLYVEVTYWGDQRRAYSAIYTDAARTELLKINVAGTDYEQYSWTNVLPAGKSFTLTDVAMFNYVGIDFMGTIDGGGSGSYDDVYVNVPEPATMLLLGGMAAPFVLKRRRRK